MYQADPIADHTATESASVSSSPEPWPEPIPRNGPVMLAAAGAEAAAALHSAKHSDWPVQRRAFALLDLARSAARHPLIRRTTRAAAGRVRDRLREEICVFNLPLVRHQIGKTPNHDDDMSSAFHEALGRAVDKFDIRRGTRFSTYCYRAMSNYRGEIWRRQNEYAEHVLLVGEVREAIDEAVSDEPARDATDMAEELQALLRAAEMPALWRDIIRRRFLTDPPESLDEIGQRLGFSREHARQTIVKALAALRQAAEERGLDRLAG